MEIRRAILSLSAIALFAPAIAAADDAVPCPHEPPMTQYTPPGTPAGNAQDVDWRWGDRGRWELQTKNRWIEGRYDQLWVPEQCRHVMRQGRARHAVRHRVVCQPGHYESRWIPGRYEQVQQWVWVAWR